MSNLSRAESALITIESSVEELEVPDLRRSSLTLMMMMVMMLMMLVANCHWQSVRIMVIVTMMMMIMTILLAHLCNVREKARSRLIVW